MRGPQYDRICWHFPFQMALKYLQFRVHREHGVSCEGIAGKTVLGSVATVATTHSRNYLHLGLRDHTLKVVAAKEQVNAAFVPR